MKKKIFFVLALALSAITEQSKADFVFGKPVNMGPLVNSSYNEHGVCISSDGLEFYFVSDRPGGNGGYDLWVRKRAIVGEEWGSPVNAGSPANTPYSYWEPTLSSDGLTLYFSDGHSPPFGNHLPGGLGGLGDIWMLSRQMVDDHWDPPVNIGPTINSQHAVSLSLSTNGLSLYFQSHRSGHLGEHCDIMVATRDTISNAFGTPVFLENINSLDSEWMPDISSDGLTLFFCRNMATELWMARRTSIYDDFDASVKLPPQINIPSYINASPTLSADGSILYFGSDRPGGIGGYDLWRVSINPIVDLNADGRVDQDDLEILMQSWGSDEPLCDIGPMPFGDGVVDVRDLVVLSKYMCPTPVAHWKFDEVEDMFAKDSAGDNDAVVVGSASWQPGNGQLNGALQLDGLDDCALADLELDPAKGPFSIFAWVKVALKGRVVVSQQCVSDWLKVDAHGKLMTELKDCDGLAYPLLSEKIITDGQWYRIGLVWHGSRRILYVDSNAVAEDTLVGLDSSQMGLYIGVDKNYSPESFFAGMIDDVLIYDIALTPEQIEGLTQ